MKARQNGEKAKQNGEIEQASARPWRVEFTTHNRKAAVVKGADDAIVAVCNVDNAEKMVAAVNAVEKVYIYLRLLSRDFMMPEQAAWIDEATRLAEEGAK